MYYKNIKRCRICGSAVTEVIWIEPQFLSPTFVKNQDSELSKIKVPLTLVLCDRSKTPSACGLLQLKETVNPDILYGNYFYRSSTSTTMRVDLKAVVDDALARVRPEKGDIVMDIGANDCTMISYFPSFLKRIAVEPAKNIDHRDVDKSIIIVNDYFSGVNVSSILKGQRAKIITCTAMFYDLDDPNKFVSEIKSILAPDGVWCIQLSYLLLMLKNMNFYDICHEHLEYYSLSVLDNLMQKHGMFIFDGSLNRVNGGSARVFIAHKDSNKKRTPQLEKLLADEAIYGLFDSETYRVFYAKIEDLSKHVKDYILNEIKNKKLVIGLGASTKGNVLLQLFGIGNDILPFISERNPEKVGLRTLGTNIELISEEHARRLNPGCMLVLPWYFKDEIVKRELEYLNSGGKLLFPMPYPHVVTKGDEIRL